MDNEFEITAKALEKAKEAFQECLSELGYDPGYWNIKFIAWLLTNDFKRYKKIEIEEEIENDEIQCP